MLKSRVVKDERQIPNMRYRLMENDTSKELDVGEKIMQPKAES